MGNLALLLQYQGKYSEAEKPKRRVLERKKEELGTDHPDMRLLIGYTALLFFYASAGGVGGARALPKSTG
jgi:hypothetical protein